MRAAQGQHGNFVGDLLVNDPHGCRIALSSCVKTLDHPLVKGQTVAYGSYFIEFQPVKSFRQVHIAGHQVILGRSKVILYNPRGNQRIETHGRAPR